MGGIQAYRIEPSEPSGTEDYLLLRKIYEGNGTTTKAPADKATGLEIILTSPIRYQTWVSWMAHLNIGLSIDLVKVSAVPAIQGLAVEV